jgi:hypothetical protein
MQAANRLEILLQQGDEPGVMQVTSRDTRLPREPRIGPIQENVWYPTTLPEFAFRFPPPFGVSVANC